MSREAMKQALEALESDPITHAGLVNRKQAIAVLRQALETEQEPVAWASSLDFDDDDQEIIPAKDKGKLGTSNCDIPLYTTPKHDYVIDCPRCGHYCGERTWVGLTDDEIEALFLNEDGVRFARYIESRLKDKNA